MEFFFFLFKISIILAKWALSNSCLGVKPDDIKRALSPSTKPGKGTGTGRNNHVRTGLEPGRTDSVLSLSVGRSRALIVVCLAEVHARVLDDEFVCVAALCIPGLHEDDEISMRRLRLPCGNAEDYDHWHGCSRGVVRVVGAACYQGLT